MDPIAEFFTRNIIVVYFFYGLAFFVMGLVVWLESNRTSEFHIARVFSLLAGFGIIHGLHEWFEMFQKISQSGATDLPSWLFNDTVRIIHLVASFLFLIAFGVILLFSTHQKDGRERKGALLAAGVLFAIWLISVLVTRWLYQPDEAEFITSVDVLSRYVLGIPGALLAAWAIVLEQRSIGRNNRVRFGRDLQWAAWALILYGIVGQLFVPESFLFPSTIINADLFIKTFGIPIQFFRATEAVLMAIFFIRALRKFEVERQKRLSQAQNANLAAQQAAMKTQEQARQATEQLNLELREREELLAELLHKVVTAQEGERRRIARELHDGTGQILTGLGLGLAATNESIQSDPKLARKQIVELKELNAHALEELHHVIGDLRPAVLDDLGLVPALMNQVKQFEARFGVAANFQTNGPRCRLQPEVETTIFRIGQEALTNIAKHAKATTACVELNFHENCMKLIVKDDGCGFNPETELRRNTPNRTAWGLLGIQERASLVGGVCFINSKIGGGTTIHVTVPIENPGAKNVKD
jgi:signal transduction histidine kinase